MPHEEIKIMPTSVCVCSQMFINPPQKIVLSECTTSSCLKKRKFLSLDLCVFDLFLIIYSWKLLSLELRATDELMKSDMRNTLLFWSFLFEKEKQWQSIWKAFVSTNHPFYRLTPAALWVWQVASASGSFKCDSTCLLTGQVKVACDYDWQGSCVAMPALLYFHWQTLPEYTCLESQQLVAVPHSPQGLMFTDGSQRAICVSSSAAGSASGGEAADRGSHNFVCKENLFD